MSELYELLGIEKGVTAIIGAGGKTSLICALAAQLARSGSVIIATTTKIYPMEGMKNLTGATEYDIKTALISDKCVCVGEAGPEGKLVASRVSIDRLAALADCVLVEADGAKRLPAKAHREYEPVIPQCAKQTILVSGLCAVGRTIRDAAHRADLFARICACEESDVITPEMIARVINFEKLCDRVFINLADENFDLAKRVAKCLYCPTVAGDIRKGVYKCLS